MMIYNARLLTMEDDNYEKGYVSIENGKIASLGDMTAAPMPELDDYDAEGCYVLPGFIDGHCHTGLCIWDITETASPITPEMKIIDSLETCNPDFQDAVRAGITAGAISPGSSNLIGGEVALVKFTGCCIDEMLVRVCGMKGALGSNPLEENGRINKRSPYSRMGSVALLRDTFARAQRYERAKIQGSLTEIDLRYEALLPVIRGDLPMHIHVHRSDDIMTAIRITKEFGIRLVILHATGGHVVARQIAACGVPVILGPILFPNCKPEMAEGDALNINRLSDAGVDFCFGTDAQVIRGMDLPTSAAIAVGAGLDEACALRALTRDTARILGVEDRMGSIRPGKDADITVFSDFPLAYTAKAKAVFINGKRAF